LRFVEANKKVAGSDVVVVTHRDLRDHASGGMLNLLQIILYYELAGSDDRSRNFRRRGPPPNSADKQKHRNKATDNVASDRSPHW
jgi:hypothetical protein